MYNIAITGPRPHVYKFASRLPGTSFDNLFTSSWSLSFMAYITDLILIKARQYGKVRCITGMALGVDQLFAMAALNAKEQCEDIYIHAAIPCANHSGRWPKKAQDIYNKILSGCDEVYLVHNGPYNNTCMQERNEYMVDLANELIAIYDGKSGGTANCIRYARETHCRINIFSPLSFIGEPSENKAS